MHGNIRELKTQVIMHFNQINRRYKDFTHNGNAMLHFICQEVSQQHMRIEWILIFNQSIIFYLYEYFMKCFNHTTTELNKLPNTSLS